ncbi:hypothetical protein PLESTM_001376800, partial [Pleodorina starrii]
MQRKLLQAAAEPPSPTPQNNFTTTSTDELKEGTDLTKAPTTAVNSTLTAVKPPSPLPPSPPSPSPPSPPVNFTMTSTDDLTEAPFPAMNSTAAMLLNLQSLVKALDIQVSAAKRVSASFTSSAYVLSAAAQTEASEEWNKKMAAGMTGLLQARKAAVDAALARSTLVLTALDGTLSATANQEAALYDTAVQLAYLVASTEAAISRAVYGTMIMEEASGQYEYVWERCPGRVYSLPLAETIWRFNISAPKAVAAGRHRRSMASKSLFAVVPYEKEPESAGLGYKPVANTKTPEKKFLSYDNASAFIDRRMFRSLHLVGGVMLHGVRRPLDEQGRCTDTRGVFTKLIFDCMRHDVPGAHSSTSSSIVSFLLSLFRSETNSLHPYGTDPVFLPSSSLYDARLSDKVNQYYNVTPGSNEVSVTGAPYSYYAKRLQGYPDGFPVLLPNHLTEQRLRQMISYLKDSNFLDSYTRRLTAEVLALSTELKVFGHMVMTFTWARDGSVKLVFRFTGQPALTYLRSLADAESLSVWAAVTGRELAGLWALTLLFFVVVSVKVGGAVWRVFRTERSLILMWNLSSHLLFDVLVAVMLLVALSACTWYMLVHAAVFSARQHYQVYDGILTARARWLLPLKINPWDIQANSAQAAMLQSSIMALNITQPTEAGRPGRYLLPDAPNDQLNELAAVLDATHRMSGAWTVYGILQALTQVLLIGRLLSSLAFQGRIGAVVRTLRQMVPPMIHLFVVMTFTGILLASMAHVLVGTYVGPASTLSGAIGGTLTLLLSRGVMQSLQIMLPADFEFTFGQRLAVMLILLSQVVLLSFMLINFFYSIIVDTFLAVKAGRRFRNGSTLWKDMRMTLIHDLIAIAQRWSRKARCGLLDHPSRPPLLTSRQMQRISQMLLPPPTKAVAGVRPQKKKLVQAIMMKPREDDVVCKKTGELQHGYGPPAAVAAASESGSNDNDKEHSAAAPVASDDYLDFDGLQTLLHATMAQRLAHHQKDPHTSKQKPHLQAQLAELDLDALPAMMAARLLEQQGQRVQRQLYPSSSASSASSASSTSEVLSLGLIRGGTDAGKQDTWPEAQSVLAIPSMQRSSQLQPATGWRQRKLTSLMMQQKRTPFKSFSLTSEGRAASGGAARYSQMRFTCMLNADAETAAALAAVAMATAKAEVDIEAEAEAERTLAFYHALGDFVDA